ncbi:MAG: hypothetical protein KGM46_05155 [Pseudomonadota bacterium]|nr:hypothetical protein [Xanthomonadaceae bacterium]MDE3210110.1 hypothetical protein [Pseudomonadota bacterium]
MANRFLRGLPVALLALALPLAAAAAGPDSAVAKQAGIAGAHAGMALAATDLNVVHMHLHHVINCLVGPAGKAFDAHQADPCKGMGQGALVDARGDAATEASLRMALADAEHGLKTSTLAGAHADAQKALTALRQK